MNCRATASATGIRASPQNQNIMPMPLKVARIRCRSARLGLSPDQPAVMAQGSIRATAMKLRSMTISVAGR